MSSEATTPLRDKAAEDDGWMSSEDNLTSILKELAVIENYLAALTAALTRDQNSDIIPFFLVISTILHVFPIVSAGVSSHSSASHR